MSFKINVTELLRLRVGAIKEKLNNPDNRKKLGELKFFDLLTDNATPRKGMRHGVYLFFNDKGRCAYVGKTSSQHFAQRLGTHFGMSGGHEMNDYLRRTVKKYKEDHPELKNDPRWRGHYKPFVQMVSQMHDHSVALIAVNGWVDGDKVRCVYMDAGGKDVFPCVGGKTNFIAALETVFQAIYCPPANTPGDRQFLIKPKRGRPALRRLGNKITDDTMLAECLHCAR